MKPGIIRCWILGILLAITLTANLVFYFHIGSDVGFLVGLSCGAFGMVYGIKTYG